MMLSRGGLSFLVRTCLPSEFTPRRTHRVNGVLA
ncbi:MAG: hypothetical protein JWL84_3211 [Rhodospirillales bacterium]|nr:hypothetical protein [Rhodospirillales bacterium]